LTGAFWDAKSNVLWDFRFPLDGHVMRNMACACDSDASGMLAFKHRASYIKDGHTATLQMLHFYIFSTNVCTEYFKHAAHSPFFSLQKAVYFIMLPFLVSCIIHILHTGCAKI
jgi:hypothetical protein